MKFANITNVQFENIDYRDYPDFVDAYIETCDIDGKPATEAQLEDIQSDHTLWYELLTAYIH